MLIKRPIYNQQLNCIAVEILANQQAREHSELFELFATILKNIDAELLLFIPYSLRFLLEKSDVPIANPLILKLHATEINNSCSQEELTELKYKVALQMDSPEHLAWLNFAEYIALSETLIKEVNVSKVVKYSQARNAKVIAYNLSEQDSFTRCNAMSMDYFCGDFLFQPTPKENNEIAANKLNLLELISNLQQENIDLDAITALIQSDPILSYQLLKLVNSSSFSSYQALESIQQAVMRLGVVNLKNWAMVLSMTKVANKPLEIIESGLMRAHMAQKLAETQPALSTQSAYTAGLLSVLDSLMDTPMNTLLETITLADDVKTALLSHKGPLGELLAAVINYEKGQLVNQQHEASYLGFDLNRIYISCLEKVVQSKQAMSGLP